MTAQVEKSLQMGVTLAPRGRSAAQRESYRLAFWLLLPATVGLIAFTFLPILYAFYAILTIAIERWTGY